MNAGQARRAPIAVWRDALLNLAYEYEMPNVKKCPLVKTNKLVMECEALAIMCVGEATCLERPVVEGPVSA